jgi:hypothetical protein
MGHVFALDLQPRVAFQDLIQDAIDELPGLVVGEPLRQLKSLIDTHLGRHLGHCEQFVQGGPQNIPVHDRHPVHAPVSGMGRYQPVQLGALRHDTLSQPVRELSDIRCSGIVLPEIFEPLIGVPLLVAVTMNVPLEQNLKCPLSGLASRPHAAIIAACVCAFPENCF